MFEACKKIFSQKKSYLRFFVASILVSFVIMVVSQTSVIVGILKLFGFFDREFYTSLISVFAGTYSAMSFFGQTVFILFVIGFGVNTVLFIEYYKIYKNLIEGSGAHLSIVGVGMAALGTGCLSCGVLLLAPLTSILGISFASWMIQHGTLLSSVGLIFILISSYFLLKKIAQPQVCAALAE